MTGQQHDLILAIETIENLMDRLNIGADWKGNPVYDEPKEALAYFKKTLKETL